jgi:predicted Zn-dependent protease
MEDRSKDSESQVAAKTTVDLLATPEGRRRFNEAVRKARAFCSKLRQDEVPDADSLYKQITL